MSQFEFDFVERYDAELADEGREFEVHAENGSLMGKFTTALYSQENRRVKLTTERVRRKHMKDLRLKPDDADLNERIAREIFIEAVLLGWSGITSKGKEVPYSKEAALAYFSHEKGKFVFGKLLSESMDPLNFQAEDKGEVLGN